MKLKLTTLLLLLPFIALAQFSPGTNVPGTLQRNDVSGWIRYLQGANQIRLATYADLTGAIPVGLSDSLLNKANKNFNNVAAGAIANSKLANSTISGISLGGTLANLTATDGTLNFSGTYNGSSARTIGINLANTNVWTGAQSMTNSLNVFAGTLTGTAQSANTVFNDGAIGGTGGNIQASSLPFLPLQGGALTGALTMSSGAITINRTTGGVPLILKAGTSSTWQVGQNAGSSGTDGNFSIYSSQYGASHSSIPILVIDPSSGASTFAGDVVANSDSTLKKNIKKLKNVSRRLRKLGAYSYDLKADNAHKIGMVAQEMKKHFPELVRTDPETNLLSINYQSFTTVLLKGWKELDQRITKLERKK